MKALGLLVVCAGCALFSKSSPVETRYFSPETLRNTEVPQKRVAEPARVRLGRISPSSHLRQRIVHRASPVEVALYQSRLWTEDPDEYVRRSLERALFEQRGLDQAVSGHAVTLDVEVIAFEELRAPRHAGRVQLRYRLRDERTVLESGVVTSERDVRGAGFDAVVDAIGAALNEATGQVADRVVRRLNVQ